MEFRSFPEALRSIMEQRGWEQIALARELGKSQAWVSKVSRGERDTPIGQASRMLARLGWEVVIRPKEERSEPVKRREFHDKIVKLASGAVAGKVTGVAFVPSAKTTPYHNPEYVRLLAERTARLNDEIGGASEAGWVIRQAKSIETASVSGNRDLHAAASWFMRRASYILRHAGKNDAAEQLASSAVVHAVKGGDSSQQGAARATLGMMYLTKGKNDLAVVHAQRGLKLPDITSENRAWLNATLGFALSGIPQQERKSRAAIDNALAVEDLSVIDRADVMGFSGLALHNVGADRHALTALSEAVELSANHSPLYQAAYVADQTTVALATASLSQAAAFMRELAYLAPLVDSRRVDGEVTQIFKASDRWAHVSEIRQAREQLMSVVRT